MVRPPEPASKRRKTITKPEIVGPTTHYLKGASVQQGFVSNQCFFSLFYFLYYLP